MLPVGMLTVEQLPLPAAGPAAAAAAGPVAAAAELVAAAVAFAAPPRGKGCWCSG